MNDLLFTYVSNEDNSHFFVLKYNKCTWAKEKQHLDLIISVSWRHLQKDRKTRLRMVSRSKGVFQIQNIRLRLLRRLSIYQQQELSCFSCCIKLPPRGALGQTTNAFLPPCCVNTAKQKHKAAAGTLCCSALMWRPAGCPADVQPRPPEATQTLKTCVLPEMFSTASWLGPGPRGGSRFLYQLPTNHRYLTIFYKLSFKGAPCHFGYEIQILNFNIYNTNEV